MTENTRKLTEALRNNPQMKEKFSAEAKRLLESGEAAEWKEALAKAAKSVQDLDLTADDLESLKGGARELTPDELEKAAGGYSWSEFWDDLVDAVVRYGGHA